jgi:aerobic-type carbon monoxide dehydrogenase small subunit (CoxS/CutS family)
MNEVPEVGDSLIGRTSLMPDIKQLRINGAMVRVSADGERSLLGVLRDDLGLTGAKYGCGEGRCGACTVLIDGEPARSCVTKLGAVAAREITTIEGLEKNGRLHPLQEAFLELGAMQCGYCTCGMIMSGVGLLRKNPQPTREEIVEHMNGNICRCGTYPRIVAALATAAKTIKEARR